MILDFVNWHVSPEILHSPIPIRYYGLFFALAFFVGYKIMEFVYKKEGLPVAEVDRLSLYMIISVVVGARLGHVLFYEPRDYLKDPLEILAIWHGGLASHGAAIGILIGMFLYTRKGPVKSYMWILDRIILTVPIGGFFVRMGNLMNSEIYGKETNLPWGFIFYDERGAPMAPRHPTQIYEGIGYVIIFVILFTLYNKRRSQLKPGMLFGLFLILLFGLRFIVEFFKEVQEGWEKDMINSIGLNQGQLLSVPFIAIGIFILIRSFRLTPKEPI